jgi:ABC-type multidrug transport system ATPase subunit
MSSSSPFILAHFKAIIYRRWILVKRSLKSLIGSLLTVVGFASLAVICYYLMKVLMIAKVVPISFNDLTNKNSNIMIEVAPELAEAANPYIDTLVDMFKNDTGLEPTVFRFNSRGELNSWMYNNSADRTGPGYIAVGVGFHDLASLGENHSNEFIIYFNSTEAGIYPIVTTLVARLEWKTLFGGDKDFSLAPVPLLKRLMNLVFGYLAPMLVGLSLLSIIPLLITQPIVDVNGEVRPYMISCNLSILCYWTATFTVDFVVWIAAVTLVWALFLACQVASFLDNKGIVLYSFIVSGPCFIVFCYCISFFFSSADAAPRQAFLVMTVALLIPVIVDVIIQENTPIWLEWLYACVPPLHVQRLLNYIVVNIGIWSHGVGHYFKHANAQTYLVMDWINIMIYGAILWIIETVRGSIQKRRAAKDFRGYDEFFRQEKARHPLTQEAINMEEAVRQSHDWAVRIENCSRLFFNTAGDPLPAVNSVSLGVKGGSLFGFLGANGAGKTTLIKMITSMLPPSEGTIELFGQDISTVNDHSLISICPQFNTHLCQEMTPLEHFRLYCMLYQMLPEEFESETRRLLSHLELEPIKDKPLRELSAGDIRKLAIALSFLGPARIMLLDEPTASLDPVARHLVHEMILQYKGDKTFMLCTHLLSEAESLCDMISIMIKGCIYTVGPPGYLSDKFGTEYRVDVMLEDDTEQTSEKCDEFFARSLPTARLAIARPKARIYNVPARNLLLPRLFTIMEHGRRNDAGFVYYTCSSSSLERVFMEIVKMSECDDVVYRPTGSKAD